MTSVPAKDFQYKAVSAGIALGLCIVGRHNIPSAKLPLEFAFRRAWQRWVHREQFPAVGKVFDLRVPTLDPYLVLTKANERVRTPLVPFYWDSGEHGGYQIYGRPGSDWDPDDPEDLKLVADHLSPNGAMIPASSWEALARDLLAELKSE